MHKSVNEFVTDWNKNKLYLNSAKEAIVSINNTEVRTQVTNLQRDLFSHYKNRRTAKADENFKKLKEVAKEQTERLGSATATVLNYYRFHDKCHRYREIDKIEEIPAAKQVTVPGVSPEARVSLLLSMAKWAEPKF
ncbi:hypothetical protein TrLO_g6187 [Triparma laevis f. longispina]|uniref:Uncharacterized protein n=1 Tax=Triparma laevis f. longispina TaxID=1714387 RepID=A0A9W7FUS6_9STRA|nr:hypothetical protein TrLO_g6187 [Triparma laevis f. longispina]